MKSQLIIHKYSYLLFKGYAFSIVLSTILAIFFETPLPLLLPIAMLICYQVLVDYEKLYLLLFLCLPLSTEVFITDHLATDLPTEPLIIGLMLIYVFVCLTKPYLINSKFIRHPLSILILLHLFWIALTTFTSSEIGFSFKFLLAKIWYIVTFFYFTQLIIKDEKKTTFILWLIAIPLTIATTKVIIHHAILEFGFKEINEACPPFFRNHVNYSAILTVFFPFLLFLNKWSNGLSKKTIQVFLIIISFGILTAFTRAAYVALIFAFIAYWVFRLRLAKLAMLISTIVVFGLISFLITKNKFMELVPTSQTVAHVELSELVASTAELEDVSTMERYYRWIAGAQMVVEKPLLGFGPGNFYYFYKQYTLNKFSTYVSDNPEKSGIHNYYLMTLIEQGVFGLVIFLILIYYIVIHGERIFHESENKKRKDLVMATLLSVIIIDSFLVMNDMIETDKIGSFFFFNIAVLVIIDLLNKKEKTEFNLHSGEC
ncbi:MAG: O-antigen ligase family protein [Saprospiraceae bacterium]|nr:O-antigen ligase family protein [Saprospiraceae bacterium]